MKASTKKMLMWSVIAIIILAIIIMVIRRSKKSRSRLSRGKPTLLLKDKSVPTLLLKNQLGSNMLQYGYAMPSDVISMGDQYTEEMLSGVSDLFGDVNRQNKGEYFRYIDEEALENTGLDPNTAEHAMMEQAGERMMNYMSKQEKFRYGFLDDYVYKNPMYLKLKKYFNDLMDKLGRIKDGIVSTLVQLVNKYQQNLSTIVSLITTFAPVIVIKGKSLRYWMICYGSDVEKAQQLATVLTKYIGAKLLDNVVMRGIFSVINTVKSGIKSAIDQLLSLSVLDKNQTLNLIFTALGVSDTTKQLYYMDIYDYVLNAFNSMINSNKLITNYIQRFKDLQSPIAGKTWGQYFAEQGSCASAAFDTAAFEVSAADIQNNIQNDPKLQAAAIPADAKLPDPPQDVLATSSSAQAELGDLTG